MKLLHLDSSILGDESASRAISAAVVERLRSAHPGIEVAYRDLAAGPLPHLTMDAFAGPQSQEILQEFLGADIIVIGVGLYNFTIPSQLKAWIDRILVAGKTFTYGERGPQGLVEGKRVIVALARGAVYGGDSPMAAWEHAETLLKLTLTFIGVTNPEFIVAEGLKLNEETRRASLEAALQQAQRLGNGLFNRVV